jgi:cathepsin A (carboxypeptidase C)
MLFPLIVSAAPSQVVLDDQVDVSILSKANTRTPTGRMTAWNVHTHAAFPKYSIRTKEDVKLCDPNVKQVTGYLDVDGDKHFYFWFFESRDKPATDPLVLWLNGGPGCSSFTGLLMELGPCRVNPGGKDTTLNPDSWNSRANVIFLDQPVNTGFSYTEGEDVRTSDKAAEDVYAFLQIFLKDYPKYASSNFTVTGESYAGHYIPAIAHAIQESNLVISQSNPKKLQRVNLESIAIGNGLTDPLVQYEYYPDMACDTKYGPVLDEATCEGMRSKYDTCKSLINACYRWRTPFSCVYIVFI